MAEVPIKKSMPKPMLVAIEPTRYTRVDFAALRARLQKVPTETVIRLYYSDDALDAIKCQTPALLEGRLDELRERMATRLERQSPALAALLADARKHKTWSKAITDALVNAAEQPEVAPQLDDPVALWYRPRFASALKAGGAHSLRALKKIMETAGAGWYKPMPRIGRGKALRIEYWFRSQPSLGSLTIPVEYHRSDLVTLHSGSPLLPLDRLASIEGALCGANGANRNTSFCLISAKTDLEAVEAYLYKFRGKQKTLLSYKKELGRFVLWCVLEKRIAMSSVMTDECEAYKDFLADVPSEWCGPRAPFTSGQWRPFNGQLLPQSQKYAVQTIQAFFSWLGEVRYLGGNPWRTVQGPHVDTPELEMDIETAIPKEIWDRMTTADGYLDRVCEVQAVTPEALRNFRSPAVRSVQFRIARAAILMMGMAGVRREEATTVKRKHLKPVPGRSVWELSVLGKRKKWRSVYLPERAIRALRAHWADRQHDFDAPENCELALLSPVFGHNIARARLKHGDVSESASASGAGFTPSGLHLVVVAAVKRLGLDEAIPLNDRAFLTNVTSHALRHTFATHAVAQKMPTDVLRGLMGHASIHTTSIYVRAERTRAIEEVEKLYANNAD